MLLFLAVSVVAQAPDAAEFEPTEIQIKMYEEAMRRRGSLFNQDLDPECCRIAQRWAERMAADRNMRHGGGEQIIAMGYRSISSCFTGWMNSGGHRAWVLSSSPRCGYGAAQSANGTWFYAGCFRGRRSVEVERERTVETQNRSSHTYSYRRQVLPTLFRCRRR